MRIAERLALVDPSEVWNLGGDREPMGVVDVLEAEFLEHLARFEVGIDDSSGDVFVLFGQPLRHKLDDQRAESASLKALVDLE